MDFEEDEDYTNSDQYYYQDDDPMVEFDEPVDFITMNSIEYVIKFY